MVELEPKENPSSGSGTPSVAGVGTAVFDVRPWSSGTASLTATSWGTSLEAELKWSLDRSSWHSFPSSKAATADATFQLDLLGYAWLGLDVTTADATASGLTLSLWGQA